MDKSENCSRYRDCAENWENYFCLYLVLDPLSKGSRGSNREMKPPLTLHHARLCGPVDIIRSPGQTSSSLSNVLPSHWATLSPVTHPGLDKWPSSLPAPPSPQLPIESPDQITVANLYNPTSQVSHRPCCGWADFIGKQDNSRVHHDVSHIPGL